MTKCIYYGIYDDNHTTLTIIDTTSFKVPTSALNLLLMISTGLLHVKSVLTYKVSHH